MGRFSWSSWEIQCHHKGPCKTEEWASEWWRLRKTWLLTLKWKPQTAGQGKGNGFSSGASRKNTAPRDTLILAPWDLCQTPVFSAMLFLITCCNNKRKLRHWGNSFVFWLFQKKCDFHVSIWWFYYVSLHSAISFWLSTWQGHPDDRRSRVGVTFRAHGVSDLMDASHGVQNSCSYDYGHVFKLLNVQCYSLLRSLKDPPFS